MYLISGPYSSMSCLHRYIRSEVDPSACFVRLYYNLCTLRAHGPTAFLWTPLVYPLWPGVQFWLPCDESSHLSVFYWRMLSVCFSGLSRILVAVGGICIDLEGLCKVRISQGYVFDDSSLYVVERLLVYFIPVPMLFLSLICTGDFSMTTLADQVG